LLVNLYINGCSAWRLIWSRMCNLVFGASTTLPEIDECVLHTALVIFVKFLDGGENIYLL
jgi:hypothetical protein